MFRRWKENEPSRMSSSASASSSPPKRESQSASSNAYAALVLDAPTGKPSKALKNSGFPRTHFKCPDGRYALGKQYLVVPESNKTYRKEIKGFEDFMNRNARPESDSNASILLAHFYEATHRMTAKLLLVAKRESVAMFDYNAPSKDGCVKLLRIDRLNERSSRSSSSYLYNPNGGGGGSQYSNSTKGMNGCLLYTSPSPRDGLLSRMPSSA